MGSTQQCYPSHLMVALQTLLHFLPCQSRKLNLHYCHVNYICKRAEYRVQNVQFNENDYLKRRSKSSKFPILPQSQSRKLLPFSSWPLPKSSGCASSCTVVWSKFHNSLFSHTTLPIAIQVLQYSRVKIVHLAHSGFQKKYLKNQRRILI